jgi:hypothetical protein
MSMPTLGMTLMWMMRISKIKCRTTRGYFSLDSFLDINEAKLYNRIYMMFTVEIRISKEKLVIFLV